MRLLERIELRGERRILLCKLGAVRLLECIQVPGVCLLQLREQRVVLLLESFKLRCVPFLHLHERCAMLLLDCIERCSVRRVLLGKCLCVHALHLIDFIKRRLRFLARAILL